MCESGGVVHVSYGKNKSIHPGSWHPTEKTGQIGRQGRRQADADADTHCSEMGDGRWEGGRAVFNFTHPPTRQSFIKT